MAREFGSKFWPRMRDGITKLGEQYFNPIWDLIDRRLDVLETLKISWEQAVADLTQFGLRRIDESLAPAIERIGELAELGFLIANTEGNDAPLVQGQEHLLFVVEEQRELFTPTPWVVFIREAERDDFAVVRMVAYDPQTGAFTGEIVVQHGDAGPFGDWIIAASAGVWESVFGLAAQVAADKQAVADDRVSVSANTPIAVAAKNDAVAAMIAAEAAAAAAATWDPVNYWSKALSYSAAQIDALRNLDRDPLDRLAIQPVSYLDFSGDYAVASGWFTRSGTALSRKVNGLLTSVAANTLRIDHAQGKVKGALLEPAATNLALHSQDLSNAAWAKVRCSVSANTGLASDGTTTLDKIVEDGTATNTHVAEQSVNFGSAGYKTIRVEARAGERTWCYLSAFDSTSAGVCGVYFDLANAVAGTVVSGSGVIERLDNGNCLISVTGNFAAGTGGVDIFLASGDGAAVYSGNGSSGAYFGEVQSEDGRAATSRIRTAGATATRNADVLTISGTDFSEDWNALECSVVIDFEVRTNLGASVAYIWSITDGTGGNLLGLRVNGATGNLELIVLQAGSANAYLPVSAVAPGQRHRVAASFTKDAFHVSLNGGAVQSDTAGAMPAGLSQECIGHLNGGTHLYGGGHIRRRARYGKAIAAADLPKVSAL
jgi:hypothetical protein